MCLGHSWVLCPILPLQLMLAILQQVPHPRKGLQFPHFPARRPQIPSGKEAVFQSPDFHPTLHKYVFHRTLTGWKTPQQAGQLPLPTAGASPSSPCPPLTVSLPGALPRCCLASKAAPTGLQLVLTARSPSPDPTPGPGPTARPRSAKPRSVRPRARR